MDIVLPIKHRVQIDNTGGEGYRECFLTCSTMLTDFLLDGWLTSEAKRLGLAEPEDVFAKALARHGDTTDWSAQAKTLRGFGIQCYKSTSASLNDVSHSLHCKVPVIIGTKYKTSGHIVLVTGRTDKGFIVLCPNGIRQGSSNNWHERFLDESDAKADHFSWSLLKQVFTDLGDEAGWALFVTSVNGKPTGVRVGL
jgi:hypothetical protein